MDPSTVSEAKKIGCFNALVVGFAPMYSMRVVILLRQLLGQFGCSLAAYAYLSGSALNVFRRFSGR
jgi:hypothetical protein